jgi:ATP-dependent Lon protease
MTDDNLDPTTDKPNTNQSELDEKVQKVFGDLSIDKRRLPMTKLDKRGIPAYVAEWAIDTIVPNRGELSQENITKIHDWSNKFIPGPEEAKVIQNRLLNGETIKVLTSMEVDIKLTRNKQDRVAQLKLLQISDAIIADGIVDKYHDLLKQGMWGVAELVNGSDGVAVVSFKPMQATFDLNLFKQSRKMFTLREWMALLVTSMGYDPNYFSEEEQILVLCRLLPLVQKSMHLIELAPKGTGKSYFFENISSRVRLVSGGNISPAVLFVNNASGQWGLLARYKVVVLDEVQTLKFEKPEEIIGGLKGFLANSRLTRGGLHESSSDCSLVMLANILLDSNQNPIESPLLKELPEFLQETAFLDRFRGIIPDSFAKNVGLKADFFGDALLAFRDDLVLDQFCSKNVKLKGKKYKRNDDAIQSIASGMMKLLFPDGKVSNEDFFHYCICPAIQLRQLVWNQLQMLDAEYRQYDNLIECDFPKLD